MSDSSNSGGHFHEEVLVLQSAFSRLLVESEYAALRPLSLFIWRAARKSSTLYSEGYFGPFPIGPPTKIAQILCQIFIFTHNS